MPSPPRRKPWRHRSSPTRRRAPPSPGSRRRAISTEAKHQQRLAQLNLDWENLLHIELVPAVVRTAGDLAEVYGLRGFDAIHLASALWLKEQTSTTLYFAVFDLRLRAAAERAGLAVVP